VGGFKEGLFQSSAQRQRRNIQKVDGRMPVCYGGKKFEKKKGPTSLGEEEGGGNAKGRRLRFGGVPGDIEKRNGRGKTGGNWGGGPLTLGP